MVDDDAAAADAAIARLVPVNRASFDRLMELENHTGHALLRTGTATGVTAERWRGARADLAALWSLHQRHSSRLEELRELRGRRSVLTAADRWRVRGLLDGLATTQRPRSMDEIAAAITDTAAAVLAVFDAMDTAWGLLGPAVDRCTTHLDSADARLAEHGIATAPITAALRSRLDGMRAAALSDPLARCTGTGIDTADVDALEAECARAADVVAELVAHPATANAVLADAEAAVRWLEQREWDVALLRAKIAVDISGYPGPTPPATHAGSATVRAAVDRARACAAADDWVGFAATDLRATAAAATAAVERQLADVGRPLEVRTELRGVLDLYRLKAVALRRGEDVDLDRCFRAAHALLWTAPTDLMAAAAAVDAYRTAVTGCREDR